MGREETVRGKREVTGFYRIISHPKTGRGGQLAFSGSGLDRSNALARGSLETILSPWQLAPKK